MFVFLRLQFFQAQIQVFTLGKNFINIIFNDSLCSACFTNTNFASVGFQLCVPIYHVNFIGKIYLKFSFIQLTQLSSMCTLFLVLLMKFLILWFYFPDFLFYPSPFQFLSLSCFFTSFYYFALLLNITISPDFYKIL